MADVELVIKVPEHCFEELKCVELNESNEGVVFHAIKCILNGIPLPKGHGRLIDADVLEDEAFKCCGMVVVDYMDIQIAPTIIEKDEN